MAAEFVIASLGSGYRCMQTTALCEFPDAAAPPGRDAVRAAAVEGVERSVESGGNVEGRVEEGAGARGSEEENDATHRRILELLRSNGVAFTQLSHAPTRTSEESAAVRGVALATGAKAMFVRRSGAKAGQSKYVLAVFSAAKKMDLKAFRKVIASPRLTFADEKEVFEITGCRPGAVPPFGSLFADTTTVVDQSLIDQGETMNFNAGLRTESVGLRVADYLRVERPSVLRFTADRDE
jgi:Ala-tRNA(Pro) deacylase